MSKIKQMNNIWNHSTYGGRLIASSLRKAEVDTEHLCEVRQAPTQIKRALGKITFLISLSPLLNDPRAIPDIVI